MKINTYPDYQHLSRETANILAHYINAKPDAIVCLASGNTPVQTFHFLVEDVKAGRLNLDQCSFVGLDEWVGIEPSSPGCCRNMMDRDFFHPLDISAARIKFFDGLADDLQGECDKINSFIEASGGLDIMLVGLGLNGHIAMNEPGSSFNSYAHVCELSEETKSVGQKYFTQKTKLTRGLTLGLRHLTESKLPILMANGNAKASIVKQALTNLPSEAIPASIIQMIPKALVLLDSGAGSLL